MNPIDKTAPSQTESISFEFDLHHSPEKVWLAKNIEGKAVFIGTSEGRVVLEGRFDGGKRIITSAIYLGLDREWKLTNNVYLVQKISTGELGGTKTHWRPGSFGRPDLIWTACGGSWAETDAEPQIVCLDKCGLVTNTGHMKITATEFKAKSLALIDRVHESGEPVIITKRGRVVARLIADGESEAKPWLKVRRSAQWFGDPVKPAIDESEVEALK